MEKAIYIITNDINGKQYVGQSNNPHHRFISHLSRAKNQNDCDGNSALHAAIRKYGASHFSYRIVEWTADYNRREVELIKKYNTLVPNGYNISRGGNAPPVHFGEGHPLSVVTEEQVDRIIEELAKGELTEPQIGALFNPPIRQSLISCINRGVTHRKDGVSYPIRTEFPYNLSLQKVCDIKWLLKYSSQPLKNIARFYNVCKSTISHINNGRNYYDSTEIYPLRKKRIQPVETILAKRSTETIDTSLEMGVCAKSV